MDLPRLNSGQLGALSFTHLNAAFRRIEALERMAAQFAGGVGTARQGIVLLARVTAVSGNKAAFVEVSRTGTGTAVSVVADGITSSVGSDQYGVPIIGAGLRVDQVYPVALRRDSSGKHYYEIAATQSETKPYIVTAFTGNAPRWTYSGREARFSSALSKYEFVPDSPIVSMRNGAENTEDTATEFGVGTEITAGVGTMDRKPIRVGVVVLATPDSTGVLTFSVPNGYKVTC